MPSSPRQVAVIPPPAAARPLFEEALSIQQALHGADHPGVAGALYSLAAVHNANSSLDTVETMLSAALRMEVPRSRPTHRGRWPAAREGAA